MKKIIFLLVLITALFCERYMTVNYCNLRADHNGKAEKLKVIPSGVDVNIVDTYGDYQKIKVLSGDHKGKIGYMWTKLLKFVTDTKLIVDKQGCSLREKPTRKSKRLANVGGGRKAELIETIITWYKIQVNDDIGWVWHKSIKDIDEK